MCEQLAVTLEKMRATRLELLGLVTRLADDLLSRPVTEEGWSIRQCLIHLADAERAHRRFVQALLSGTLSPIADFDLDRWNQSRVARRAGETMAQVLDRLAAERAETLAFLPTLPATAWEEVGDHPALGRISVGQAVRIIGIHERTHLKEIRQFLAG